MKNLIVGSVLLTLFTLNNCSAQELTLRRKDDKIGFVDSNTDKWVIKPKYPDGVPFKGEGFSNQYTMMYVPDGKYPRAAIIDKTGKEPFEKYRLYEEIGAHRYLTGYFQGTMLPFVFDLKTGKNATLSSKIAYRYHASAKAWQQKFMAFPDEETQKVNLLRLSDMVELYKSEYESIDFSNPMAIIFRKDGLCAITDTTFAKPLEFNKSDTCLACTNFKDGMADLKSHIGIAKVMNAMIEKLIPDHFEMVKGKLVAKEDYKSKSVTGDEYHYAVKYVSIGATRQEIIQVIDNSDRTMYSSFYHATFESAAGSDAALYSGLAALMIKEANDDTENLSRTTVDLGDGAKLFKIKYKGWLKAVYLLRPGLGTLVIGDGGGGWGLDAQPTVLASVGIVIPPEEKEYVYSTPIIENNFIGFRLQTENQIKKYFSHESFTEAKFNGFKQIYFNNSQGHFSFIINYKGICTHLYYIAATQKLYDKETAYLIEKYNIAMTNEVWNYRSMTDAQEIDIKRVVGLKNKDGSLFSNIPIYIFGKQNEDGWIYDE